MSTETSDGPADVPGDDDPVDDDTLLYRRVHRVHRRLLPDGSYELRETAFKNPGQGRKDMSVVLGDTQAALGKSPQDVISDLSPDWGVAAIRTKVVVDEKQVVQRTRQPGEPAHGDVVGEKPRSRQRLFAEAACWAVPPKQT